MKSKILAAVADPANPTNSIFIAESAGNVRRISLEVGYLRKPGHIEKTILTATDF
jgi:hypothetical protein